MQMLKFLGVGSFNELVEQTVPKSIRLRESLPLPEGISEYAYLDRLEKIASLNRLSRTFIGLGYYNTFLLPVVQRNILENPTWYTSYTPYQAEISQGRLEALLNFQTMVMELTGMEIANASLLDEPTAVAEGLLMMHGLRSGEMIARNVRKAFVDRNVFPQTLSVLQTRAEPLGIELVVGDHSHFDPGTGEYFGCILQYPGADGEICDYTRLTETAREHDVLVEVAADIAALAILKPPGEWGADIVAGSTQRFGIPMGYGGPHAGYFATREKYKRNIPGRIIGVSVDASGKPALRMALQTREQHIKRERATSNICTAQALLASMASMYAVYHGPEGLKSISGRINALASLLGKRLPGMGYIRENRNFFDTLKILLPGKMVAEDVQRVALEHQVNFRYIDEKHVGISLDETTSVEDLDVIITIFAQCAGKKFRKVEEVPDQAGFGKQFRRTSEFLTQEVFNRYRSETELMRYVKKLERKDFSLTHSMIPLGSCTMKLNAANSLFALGWKRFTNMHPYVPVEQAQGYQQLIHELGQDLLRITGMEGISFMPNSGAAGEYAGLRVISAYHQSRGEGHRNVVLIPSSAHGTNPASAVMAGMKVVVVDCDAEGNIDMEILGRLTEEHGQNLAAIMITYPSTHGVFEEKVRDLVNMVHGRGGQVYLDGANMNAMTGIGSAATIGADVCHLNLHKTFGIPHGGGGPGMGPIVVTGHLVEFLPVHPLVRTGGVKGIPAVAGSPWGSALILTISHAYCRMLGAEGLKKASLLAVLNANYLAESLKGHYDILYTGKNGRVAHEMILDCREFRKTAGVSETDIAKRLIDYGFHAPTLSFPVHGTLMVEPTESESREELDRFVRAMISIHGEIMEIAEGKQDPENNTLKNAPHTAEEIAADRWDHPYSRKKAAFPAEWTLGNKIWPPVKRLNEAYGDRHLVCSCS